MMHLRKKDTVWCASDPHSAGLWLAHPADTKLRIAQGFGSELNRWQSYHRHILYILLWFAGYQFRSLHPKWQSQARAVVSWPVPRDHSGRCLFSPWPARFSVVTDRSSYKMFYVGMNSYPLMDSYMENLKMSIWTDFLIGTSSNQMVDFQYTRSNEDAVPGSLCCDSRALCLSNEFLIIFVG